MRHIGLGHKQQQLKIQCMANCSIDLEWYVISLGCSQCDPYCNDRTEQATERDTSQIILMRRKIHSTERGAERKAIRKMTPNQ